MDDPQKSSFARHVHEVVDLDAQGAPYEAIEARVDAMQIDREERSALWSLTSSLAHGPRTPTRTRGRAPMLTGHR